MCWSCVVEEGGDKIVLNDYHKSICNLIWRWYNADDRHDEKDDYTINNSGGDLHIQLDDHNLDDCFLQDDWNKYSVYSPKTRALGQTIVHNLRRMSMPERQIVVHHAHPYQGNKPFPEVL